MLSLTAIILIVTFLGWSRHAELNRFNKIINILDIDKGDVI